MRRAGHLPLNPVTRRSAAWARGASHTPSPPAPPSNAVVAAAGRRQRSVTPVCEPGGMSPKTQVIVLFVVAEVLFVVAVAVVALT